MNLSLSCLSRGDEAEFISFYNEFRQSGGRVYPGVIEKYNGDFAAYLSYIEAASDINRIPAGFVKSDTYVMKDGNGRIIGMSSLRHRLTEGLLVGGGNIGYGIRPSERNKGYGTKQLALVLEKCRELGLEKVLITCDGDNIASAKVAENNGGMLWDEITEEDGNILRRYWIYLSDIRLETATMADADALVAIQKAAFLRLYDIYRDEQSPYLRGTEEFERWFERGHDVYKIYADSTLAGGLTVFRSRTDAHEYYLARIYISPELQQRGIAKRAIKLCEKLYPDAKRWFLDYPEDQIANKRCYEGCGYVDTGSRRIMNDKLTLIDKEKIISGIYPVRAYQLPDCLDVIHKSFATVAKEFNLTRENSPKHTSFMPPEKMQEQMQRGWYMFGLTESEKLVGYAALSDENNGVYELNNLAVLPEYRHNGYGKLLLDHAKEKVREFGGQKIVIGIIEESAVLKEWYLTSGFIHTGTKKFDHLPFTVGFMEWRNDNADT